MAKSPVLIKGKPKGKGLFPAKAMAKQKARDYFLASPACQKRKQKQKRWRSKRQGTEFRIQNSIKAGIQYV